MNSCAHPAVSDPVMGDHGKLYVKPELVPCYKEDIVRLASIMTPNQFEAEQLVGQRIITEEDALAACQTLHDRGPSTVVCALLLLSLVIVILLVLRYMLFLASGKVRLQTSCMWRLPKSTPSVGPHRGGARQIQARPCARCAKYLHRPLPRDCTLQATHITQSPFSPL